ncbi:MAG: very short patch repair endonuclease [Nitrospinaceae bacterium]
MQRIKCKDTLPELMIRKIVHRLGYRFRLHRKDLPGKPDLTFPSRKKVVFVHGCFWHQHEDPECKIVRIPKSRMDYWVPKLRGNVERDKQHQKQLNQQGWRCLVIWECQVKNPDDLANKIVSFIEP